MACDQLLASDKIDREDEGDEEGHETVDGPEYSVEGACYEARGVFPGEIDKPRIQFVKRHVQPVEQGVEGGLNTRLRTNQIALEPVRKEEDGVAQCPYGLDEGGNYEAEHCYDHKDQKADGQKDSQCPGTPGKDLDPAFFITLLFILKQKRVRYSTNALVYLGKLLFDSCNFENFSVWKFNFVANFLAKNGFADWRFVADFAFKWVCLDCTYKYIGISLAV